jgi:hypothetical protein
MLKRFSGKPVYTEIPRLFLSQFFNLYPYATIHLSHWQFKTPRLLFFLPRGPSPFWTVPAKGKRAARLTGGEGGPTKGGVGFERSLRSQRGTARRRWWPETTGPRAQAGELVGDECSGLSKAIQVNPRARGASRDANESTHARNRRITHRGARSTFAGGRVKSGDLDPVSPARQSSIPRSGSFTEARRVSLEGYTGLEWLCWPVYGGGCSGGRWHVVCRGNTGDLVLRWGRERAGAYGWSLGWLYRRGRGQGTRAWLGAARGARGQALGVLWHVQVASNTWRCSSAHVQKLAEIANVRILTNIRRRPPPGTYGYLLYVSSKGR